MERVRIGVVGCGKVAQVMHLPYLRELEDRFEIASICDLSKTVGSEIARQYRVAHWTTSIDDLLEQDVDAVLIASSGSHAPPALAAIRANKHVLIEKPACYTMAEADELVSAAREAGVAVVVGHMKRHDPAFVPARAQVQAMGEVGFARITTLEGPSLPVFFDYPLVRADDLPDDARSVVAEERRRATASALGLENPSEEDIAWYMDLLLDSAIHELNLVSGILGTGSRPIRADYWGGARSMHTLLQAPSGALVSFAFLKVEDLTIYSQEFSFFGRSEHVSLRFPSPYLKNAATQLYSERLRDGGVVRESFEASREEAFREQLIHFWQCIVKGVAPNTSLEAARSDLELITAIARVGAARPR